MISLPLLEFLSLLHVCKVGYFPLEIVPATENRRFLVSFHSLFVALVSDSTDVTRKKTRQESQFEPSSYSSHSSHRESLKMRENFTVQPKKMYAFFIKKKKIDPGFTVDYVTLHLAL